MAMEPGTGEDDTEDLIDVLEAARLAGRSAETIRRWIWGGRLPTQREGNRHVMRRKDVLTLSGTTDQQTMTLAEWVKMIDSDADSVREGAGESAADLILEDRRSRSGGEDS
jgi:hypothetical protein